MSIDADDMLDDLLSLESGLTGWEMDYIESLANQRGDGNIQHALSERQRDKLCQIHDRLFGA